MTQRKHVGIVNQIVTIVTKLVGCKSADQYRPRPYTAVNMISQTCVSRAQIV